MILRDETGGGSGPSCLKAKGIHEFLFMQKLKMFTT